MRSHGRAFVAVVAALAVFVVGATCTQAGCLLPVPPTGGAVAPPKACCRGDAKHTTPAGSHDTPSKPCPACQQPLFGGASITKGVTHLPLTYAPIPFLAALCSEAWNVPGPRANAGDLSHRPQGQQPPTLLALRCALLI